MLNPPTPFVLCKNCTHIIYRQTDRVYSRSRILFKGKRIHITGPRKGICEKCQKKGMTNLHHEKYNDDPLKHTIELCVPCHIKRSIELKQIDGNEARKKAIIAIKKKWGKV